MGTKGTLVLEREKEVMLYKDSDTSSRVRSRTTRAARRWIRPIVAIRAPAWPRPPIAVPSVVGTRKRSSTGHGASAIRLQRISRGVEPEVALGDAVIALTCNVAMRNAAANKGGYIQFREEWFDVASDETPDGSVPRPV